MSFRVFLCHPTKVAAHFVSAKGECDILGDSEMGGHRWRSSGGELAQVAGSSCRAGEICGVRAAEGCSLWVESTPGFNRLSAKASKASTLLLQASALLYKSTAMEAKNCQSGALMRRVGKEGGGEGRGMPRRESASSEGTSEVCWRVVGDARYVGEGGR